MGEGIIADERGAYRGYSPHTSILIQPIEGDCNRITAGEFLHLLCLAGDMYDDDLNTQAEHKGFVMQRSYKVSISYTQLPSPPSTITNRFRFASL